MERLRTEAVVLKVADHGEGHRLVDLLSRERGLLRAFAPGAQRSRRRFGGALEPGTELTATLHRRSGRDLMNLDEASVRSAHAGLRGRLADIARASYLLELVRGLVRDAQPHPELYALLCDALGRLDRAEFPAWGLPAFELGALHAFGMPPRLEGCARCGRRPEAERSRLSPRAGGLLCPVCEPHWQPGDVTVGRSALQALGALAGAGAEPEILERAGHLPADPEAVADARAALEALLIDVLGRRPKSLAFLDEVLGPDFEATTS